MPDVFGAIDQIAESRPVQQARRSRRRRNPRIRETQPEADRTDREDVQSAVGESLSQALPQLESAFDTIDRPDPIDSEEDGWEMMSADDAFGEPTEDAWRNEAGGQPFQLRAPSMEVGRGNNLGAFTMRPDLDLEHPGGFRHNDSFIDDETYGPYGDDAPAATIDGDASEPAWQMMSAGEALGPSAGAWEMMTPDDAFSYGNPPPGMMAEAPTPEAPPEVPQPPEAPTSAVIDEGEDEPEEQPVDGAEWDMMSTEDALGQGSRYTSSELEDMEQARRRDKRARAVSGVLQGVGGILGMVGGLTGNDAMGSIGLGAGEGARSFADPGNYDAARTIADQRVQRDDELAAQNRRDALEAERMRVWEETQREAQDSRRAFGDLQAQQLQARIESDRAAGDPGSQASRAARATFLATLGGAPPSVQQRFQALDLESMDARSIGEAMSALETAIDDERANNPRGRGGRGGAAPRMPAAVPGGGTPRPRPVTGDVPANEPSVLERRIRAYAEARGLNPDEEVQYYDSLSGRDQRSYRQLVDRTLGRGGSGGGDDDTGLPPNIEPRTYERFASAYRQPFGRSRSLVGLTVALSRASDAQIAAALRSDAAAAGLGASELRARIYRQLNSYFHEFGGANVTPNEMARYFAGFGAGSIMTPPAAFKQAVRQLLQASRAEEADIARGYAPQYLEYWRSRGGN